MPINKLTTFCNSSITKSGKCSGCIHTCTKCNQCLQDIHFGTINRSYDCNNMIHCYTCSYIYKYASEIHYLMRKHPLTTFSEFKILSLGCGSCADLFGIDNFLTEQNRTLTITYTGVDCNSRWQSTQDKIKEIFPSYSISFENLDVFDYLDCIDDSFIPPNILILQYVLNELIKNNDTAKMNNFVENLCSKVVNRMPDNSVIIMNDINLDVGSKKIRSWFNIISEKIKSTKTTQKNDYRFTQPNSHTFGGIKHTEDKLLFPVPTAISTKYDVKQPCSSVQTIITIKNKI